MIQEENQNYETLWKFWKAVAKDTKSYKEFIEKLPDSISVYGTIQGKGFVSSLPLLRECQLWIDRNINVFGHIPPELPINKSSKLLIDKVQIEDIADGYFDKIMSTPAHRDMMRLFGGEATVKNFKKKWQQDNLVRKVSFLFSPSAAFHMSIIGMGEIQYNILKT